MIMNIQFLYENGEGSVVDEHGSPKPMYYIVDEDQFRLEALSSHTQYLAQLPLVSEKVIEAMQDKARLFKLLFEKCLSATAAAKRLGIHVCTAQKWAEQYERDPNSIFEKRRKTGRPHILNEEHKKVILECIDANPSVVLDDVMKQLRQSFTELKVSKRKTDMDFMSNCVFLDESAFHINLKHSMAWSKKDFPAVVTVPKTRAKTTTIFGAISAQGLIKCSPKLPQSPSNKKRKRGEVAGCVSKGTVTGHYVSFLKATMDEMDKYPHMKDHYLVMDNAPIHTSIDIAKYVKSRGCRCTYLPPYSPQLGIQFISKDEFIFRT
ncbi:hypothetical protein G6F37_007192 [Rhizopus arrhizus]|nr:hypothetical protein G6F38_009263 [Rhizopus arrhizus]KAG1156893.1 hypothetical protein G6F37_007192 [Rhizopus arrhizus]